ncbi:MAG: hypothetical protein U0822_18925 [Anaerolineae bacterium]
MQTSDPLGVILLVVEVFDNLGVPYFVAGSVASTIHGVMRMTMDADLVADLQPQHVAPLEQALSQTFYIDVQSIREAIENRASFNLIHLETMFKVDVFLSRHRSFDEAQFRRRVRQIVATQPERAIYVASAEDTILAKLEWYRMGGEVSERQWRDVLGIFKTQKDALDVDYMRASALELGVADLLDQATAQQNA